MPEGARLAMLIITASGPTRPTNMAAHKTRRAEGPDSAVAPVDNPTVLKAETVSKSNLR